nr:LptA/OstA family protein [Desulfobaculum xiamenense]
MTAPLAVAQSTSVPTKITSQKTVYDQDGRTVVFRGDVLVVRPDMKIWADVMTVRLDASAKQGQPGTISRIEATGNVRLEREGKKGQCAKAVYDAAKGLLTLSGDPRLADGDNSISGKVIRLWLKDNRSEVEGGDKPVEAIFFTPGAEAGK